VDNVYAPRIVEILRVREETPTERSFWLGVGADGGFSCCPGQFVTVSVFGCGEAPFGVANSGEDMAELQITVRRYPGGQVTEPLHQLAEGDRVGLRGPFGKGFPVEDLKGRDVLIVAGGIGLIPVRPLIHEILSHRPDYGRFTILMGARTPQDMPYKDELAEWGQHKDVDLRLTIDVPHPDWKGHVGLITTLFEGLELDSSKTKAVIVGPPVMYAFVITECRQKGLADEDLIFSLERTMKCGVGKCGHCAIKHKYVCTDGPVFTYAEIRGFAEEPI
jgi:NAD(P)H-flavin reductase